MTLFSRTSLLKTVFFETRFVLFIILFLSLQSFSQTSIISGYVKDSINNYPLQGVNVMIDKETGTSCDIDGYFSLELQRGEYSVSFSVIGYETVIKEITIEQGDSLVLNVLMPRTTLKIEEVVVTASRFEQRLSDVSVSIGVMKPAFISDISTLKIDNTLNYMPGLDIMDGQASIRGGSGYSYGTGSRVLVLVDDLPMLTASDGDVKWNYLPVENIAQVEVLKGASSALYGSSALNGIINIRTIYPDIKPRTNVTLFTGLYMEPERKELTWWWDNIPLFSGFSVSHAQKIKNVDIVAGANGLIDQGYREMNYDERIRLNLKFRHTPTSVKGLSYGLNTNMQWQQKSDFFIWIDADSGAFLQNPDVITPNNGFRLNVDPWVAYFDKRGNKHSLRTRYYRVSNNFEEDADKNNSSDLYYGEYQFQRQFWERLNLTAGISGLAGKTVAALYGDHDNTTIAVFSQLDYKFFQRLSASIGLRWERYTLDNTDEESGFVTRAGLNFEAAKSTFIRASFGQGYRFPSIAEKYTATSLGSLNIFPNSDLKPEKGWSAEVGVKQGFKISSWTGFFDASFFWTEYEDMIEFTFGVYNPDTVDVPTLDHVGFKSLNVGKARINGIELGISGNGSIGPVPLNMFFGYTYMNPIDLTSDTVSDEMLKYRYNHSFKGDVSIDCKKLSFGMSVIFRSFMEQIDEAFEEEILGQEIFPGLKDYRLENNTGDWVFDFRVAYHVLPNMSLSLIAKNIFNNEYMGRPGDIQPPRNITLQAVVTF